MTKLYKDWIPDPAASRSGMTTKKSGKKVTKKENYLKKPQDKKLLSE